MYFTGNTIKNYCIVACFFIFLSACSPGKNTAEPIILSQEAQGSDWNQVQIYSLDHWSLTGRIALQFEGQVEVGTLVWDQADTAYQIFLYGPAGLGGVRIQGGPGSVVIKSHLGLKKADSAEALIQELYGWDFPVSWLPFWIKAVPMPFEPFEIQSTPEGLPIQLQQGGWTVTYADYRLVKGVALPTRVQLTHALMKITIKIQRWDFLRD